MNSSKQFKKIHHNIRRGFKRLHLRTLKNFVGEKSGKCCEKIGETFDKIGKPGNFEEVHFFPVSAPEHTHVGFLWNALLEIPLYLSWEDVK